MAEQTARNAVRAIGLFPDLGVVCTVKLDGCAVSAKAVFPDILLLLIRLDFGELCVCQPSRDLLLMLEKVNAKLVMVKSLHRHFAVAEHSEARRPAARARVCELRAIRLKGWEDFQKRGWSVRGERFQIAGRHGEYLYS